MMPKQEIDKAIEIARKYGVGELYLIGSAVHKQPDEARDYDLAVRDVPSGTFFRFYGELMRSLSKTVDLVDLSGKRTKFKDIVLEEAKLIYDKRAA
jgi:predicted nucleotidyltransferase